MKKLHINSLGAALSALVGAAMLVALGASPGAAQTATTTTTTAMGATTTTTQLSTPPIQGAGSHHIVIYMDTVTGGGTPKPLADCLEENQFVQGQLVVFRMWVDDSSAGGWPDRQQLRGGLHHCPGPTQASYEVRADRGSPSYWEVPWSSKGYPVGTVNFTITVVAKPLAQWGVPQYANSKVGAQAGVFLPEGLLFGV